MGKFLALAALCATCGGGALAQGAPLTHASVELIADTSSGPETTMWAGVLFRLDSGWHIYWQNPGDSGTPPKIEWHLPAGYQAGAIRWPTPVRLGSGSVIDYGYEKQVLLMVPVMRAAGAAKVSSASDSISADVRYVVCSEICIPGKAHVALATGATGHPPAEPPQWRSLFQRTRAQFPKPAPANWKVSLTQDKDHFTLLVRGAADVKAASFIPLDAGEIENSAGQIFMGASGTDGFSLSVKKSDQLVKPLSTLRGLLVLGPGRSYEIEAPVTR